MREKQFFYVQVMFDRAVVIAIKENHAPTGRQRHHLYMQRI